MKRIIVMIIAILVLCTNVAFADMESDYNSGANYQDYETESYDVKIDVDDAWKLKIQETISVRFPEPRHGIYREIPTRGKFERDFEETPYKAFISDIKVNNKFKVEKSFDKYNIKIGDANKYAPENVKYVISYTYDLRGDRLKDGDEFYVNLIGNSWQSNIEKFTYTINMPKPFNEDNVGVKCGSGYDAPNQEFSVEGNTIKGVVARVPYGYPITIRAVLPEDYFKDAGFWDLLDWKMLLGGILAILSLLGTAIVHLINNSKKEHIPEPVEFYPPKKGDGKYLAFECERIYEDKTSDKGIMSLIFHLANQGYITIEEIHKDGLFGKKKCYQFNRKKFYEGKDDIEARFMSKLFSGRSSVDTEQLGKEYFGDDISTIVTMSDIRYPEEEMYEENSLNKRTTAVWLTAAPLAALWAIGAFLLKDFDVFVELFTPWLYIIGAVLFPASLIFSAVSISCNHLRRMRPQFKTLKGQIGGFRNFLKAAEKQRIEMLVEENPNYFYDILPYAYALDVTDAYCKNFEGINIKEPDYYSGVDTFNPVLFSNSMASALDSSSAHESSSSGGGSFSGGGGAGGGGGGSW